MHPLVFIHIPKTAGTSFRIGARNYFGFQHEARDYGAQSAETSAFIKKHIYALNDYERFRKVFDKKGIKFLTGHFSAAKYKDYFDKGTFITFVRDPIQRIISEHKHVAKNYGFRGTLKDFYTQKNKINLQSKTIGAIGTNDIGFIGLTERYKESIAFINANFNISIPYLETNVGKNHIDEAHQVAEDDLKRMIELNQKDIEFYNHIKSMFDARVSLATDNTQDRITGSLGGIRNRTIFGWSANQTREIPVELSIFVNDRCIGNALANQYRPKLKAKAIKRSGCGGFLYRIDPSIKLKPGDVITCRVKDTDFEIGQISISWSQAEHDYEKEAV